MTEHQYAEEVREFTRYLRDVVALLDPGSGWYGLFCRRDPAGMRACLDGAEIPPWDVMESLLQDLAAVRGTAFAQHESVRGAELYSASVAAHDRRPGGRQMLVERLELMLREQTYAAQHLRAAGAGGTTTSDMQAVAWARDDHERATARCSELRARLAAVSVPKGWFRTEEPDGAGEAAPGRGKPRGARFAGLDMDDADDCPGVTAPVLARTPWPARAPRRPGRRPPPEPCGSRPRSALPRPPRGTAPGNAGRPRSRGEPPSRPPRVRRANAPSRRCPSRRPPARAPRRTRRYAPAGPRRPPRTSCSVCLPLCSGASV